ncbi:MAG: hypothetical protein AAF715_27865 [Myxococcota bacterium]
MRGNLVLTLLVAMLGGFFFALFARTPAPHRAPPVVPASSAGVTVATATVGPSATLSPRSSGGDDPPATPPPPRLARPLRVVALDWALLAAAVKANGGQAMSAGGSAWAQDRLEVALAVEGSVEKLENALARGGEAARGADIAVLSLPRFVASYERLKALSPVIFFTVGYSDGREVLVADGKRLGDLPAKGDVELYAGAGSPAALLGLFAMDQSGVSPDRIRLVDDGKKAAWAAVPRTEMKGEQGQTKGNLLLSTGEATHLIPFVAIAQRSMVTEKPEVLRAFVNGWLAGQQGVARDASGIARTMVHLEGAPEPLEVLAALGQMRPASLRDNARALGLAGRGAATLDRLFTRSWALWRQAKVLTIPPEQAPIDGRIVGALIRDGGDLEGPEVPKPAIERPDTRGDPLLVRRLPGKLDEAHALEELGFLAAVFARSPIRVGVHPGYRIDVAKTDALLAQANERFDLDADRVTRTDARPQPGTAVTIEVMPIP